MFANDPGDLGSIPGQVIPKTHKMVLNAILLNTQHYKVSIKGKVEQSGEWSRAPHYTLVVEKGAFWSPSTKVANYYHIYMCVCVYIYIYRERERERKKGFLSKSWNKHTLMIT